MTGDASSAFLNSLPNVIMLTGALGTAAFGLVDSLKAYNGGLSRAGFRYIEEAIAPFIPTLEKSGLDALATLRANWINGVDKATQKAKAKALIRLAITSADLTAVEISLQESESERALAVIISRAAAFYASVNASGERDGARDDEELRILGRLDAIMEARLDAAFERAEQKYRNTAKVAASFIAVVLALCAGQMIIPIVDRQTGGLDNGLQFNLGNFAKSLLIGLAATPLAPIAKDLATTVTAAVSAVSSLKR